ncbi:hypothetical protein R3I94_010481 [Phoxinus phoxinus]
MKDATHIMSEDSTPTLSVIAPLHAQLLDDTETAGVAAADTPVIREIKLAIHDDLAKRYSSARDKRMLYSASFLDPRFKALPFLTEEDQLEIHANVIAEAAAPERQVNSEEAEVESESTPQQEEGPAPKRRPSALVTLLGKTFTEVSVVRRSASSRAEEELKKYLEAPPLSLSENPLSWWRTH